MAAPADYLNLTELRELAEIQADLTSLCKARKELHARKAKIKARGVKRRDSANAATGARV